MNLIWHIFRKDARRLLWPVLGMLAVTLLPMGLALISVSGKGSVVPTVVSFIATMMPPFVSYFLVMGFVAEDSIAGGGAFWKTRPIAGARLLAAKLIGLVLLLWVLPIVVSLPWWLGHGYGLHECGRAAAWVLFVQALLTLVALPIAALSDKLSKFFLISLYGMLLLTGVSLLGHWHSAISGQASIVAGVLASQNRVVGLILIAACAGVTFIQFLTRRSWLSWGLIVVALLSCLGVFRFWSWNISRESARKPDPAWVSSMVIRVVGGKWSSSGPYPELNGVLVDCEFSGLPMPHVASIRSVDNFVIWPDQTVSLPAWAQGEGRLEAMALALAIGQKEAPLFQSGMAFLVSDLKIAERLNRDAPAYRGKIAGQFLKMEIVADLPVVAGATASHHGFGVGIEAVNEPQGDGVRVLLSEYAPEFLTKDPSLFTPATEVAGRVHDAYFIINRRRGGVLNGNLGGREEVYSVSTVRSFHQHIDFLPRNSAERPVGDLSDWLKDAVLVKIVFLDEGTYERTVETPRLEITAAQRSESK